MTAISSPQYRPCVGIMLLNQQNNIFVGERIDTPGAWQMPQGGIDDNEEIVTAATRELAEETGLQPSHFFILEIAQEKLKYDLPPHLQKKFWNGKFVGQEQTWVLARFTGVDSDVHLNAHEPPEFQNWQWVNGTQILSMIVPFKKETYQNVIRLFKPYIAL